MHARGWKTKLAKSRGYEQSLFEHTLIELDVLLELLPVLAIPSHYGLSETEQKVLVVAVIVHDAGKETDAWQAYIRQVQRERWVPHVIPELIRVVVPELCAVMALQEVSDPVQRIMAHCAAFHHAKPGRSDGTIMEAMLSGGTDRFLTLAHLVKAIDHFCSASSAAEAEDVVRNNPALGRHLDVTRHEVAVRGVSTAFLHRAARTAFQSRGWRPLLYFANATVYASDPNGECAVPATEDIRGTLKAELDAAMARDVTPLMVGSPTGNILPKPDLFSFSESRQYLHSAARKIGAQSLARKPPRQKRKVVEDYWKLEGRTGKPTDEQVEQEAARISHAQPEMMIFKFFKGMMDPEKVEAVGKDGAGLAAKLYEETFGPASWAALQSTSTLMPARDMAKTVNYFWTLEGSRVGRPQNERVETIPPEERSSVLVDILDRIAQQVYAKIARPSPRDKLSRAMADAFSGDLLQPLGGTDVVILAREQLAYYSRSKPFAGKESRKGVYLCPICNAPFKDGVKASADFIDNPQTHTNRGVAYGSFGYVMVCNACYYERLLRQILLGGRPAEIITLMPRLNFGPEEGSLLVRKVQQWVEAAKAQMKGETGNLEFGFSLGFTDQAARHLADRDPFDIASEDLLSIFSYRFTSDTQKKRRQEATKRLKEEFDEDLETLNAACGQSFSTWEAAVDALIENRITQQELKAIRREVFRLYETMYLICQTPNLIFVPLTYEIAAGNDESDTSKGLRRLFVASLLSLVFDASVAIHIEGDPVDFQGAVGAAYVPPVPAVRSLVGHDWLPIIEARRWLAAVGAASQLVRDAGWPARSALYQAFAADPPEQIARRIEENWRKLGLNRLLSPDHVRWIDTIIGIHRQEFPV
jgi:hypothetical protein